MDELLSRILLNDLQHESYRLIETSNNSNASMLVQSIKQS